jgi:hypothetical protein
MICSFRQLFPRSSFLAIVAQYLLLFLLAFWGAFGLHWLGESIYRTVSTAVSITPQEVFEPATPISAIAEITFSPSLTHQEPNFYQ